MKKSPLTEIVVGLIWAASLVKVGGFTWEAFTSNYQPFPIGQGSNLTSGVGIANVVTGAANIATDAITSGGSIAISLGQRAAGFGTQHFTAPPPHIAARLRRHDKTVLLEFSRWAAKVNGWGRDLQNSYLQQYGLKVPANFTFH